VELFRPGEKAKPGGRQDEDDAISRQPALYWLFVMSVVALVLTTCCHDTTIHYADWTKQRSMWAGPGLVSSQRSDANDG